MLLASQDNQFSRFKVRSKDKVLSHKNTLLIFKKSDSIYLCNVTFKAELLMGAGWPASTWRCQSSPLMAPLLWRLPSSSPLTRPRSDLNLKAYLMVLRVAWCDSWFVKPPIVLVNHRLWCPLSVSSRFLSLLPFLSDLGLILTLSIVASDAPTLMPGAKFYQTQVRSGSPTHLLLEVTFKSVGDLTSPISTCPCPSNCCAFQDVPSFTHHVESCLIWLSPKFGPLVWFQRCTFFC